GVTLVKEHPFQQPSTPNALDVCGESFAHGHIGTDHYQPRVPLPFIPLLIDIVSPFHAIDAELACP
ncbi:hypothetical protein FPOAC2_10414, partial [Fusarium poae]